MPCKSGNDLKVQDDEKRERDEMSVRKATRASRRCFARSLAKMATGVRYQLTRRRQRSSMKAKCACFEVVMQNQLLLV